MTIQQTTGGIYVIIIPEETFVPNKLEIKNNQAKLYELSEDVPELSADLANILAIKLDNIDYEGDYTFAVSSDDISLEKTIYLHPGLWTTSVVMNGKYNNEDSLNRLLLESSNFILLE